MTQLSLLSVNMLIFQQWLISLLNKSKLFIFKSIFVCENENKRIIFGEMSTDLGREWGEKYCRIFFFVEIYQTVWINEVLKAQIIWWVIIDDYVIIGKLRVGGYQNFCTFNVKERKVPWCVYCLCFLSLQNIIKNKYQPVCILRSNTKILVLAND